MSRFWDMGSPLPGPYPAHPKNKSQKSGIFFGAQKLSSIHQLLPRIHHNLTTKKPSQSTQFLQNPQQKHPSTTQKKILQNYFACIKITGTRTNPSTHLPDAQAMGGRKRLLETF
jgi:hypothetical protein